MLVALAGRAVAPADWHVTLCFLGAVQPEPLAALQARAGQIDGRAFALPFEHIEYWRESRVLAATATAAPQPARALTGALRALACSTGLTPDLRALRPHVTLMRAVAGGHGAMRPGGLEQAATGILRGLTLQAREFYLAESREPSGQPAAGRPASGQPAPAGARGGAPGLLAAAPRRYSTLARWPLRAA